MAIDVGNRILAMAQRVVHHVAQVLAPRLRPPVSHRWLSRVHDSLADPLWALGAARERKQAHGPTPKPRWMPLPQLVYAQVVKSYRCRRIVAVTHRVVFGTRERVKQALAACRLADPHRLCGAAESGHASACGGGGPSCQYVVQGRGGLAAAAGVVSKLSQLLSASCQLTPAVAAAGAHQRHGLREALAPLYASDGGRVDRSCLDPERGLAVSGAAMAPASGGMSSAGWWEAAGAGSLSRRRASARPASRASPGGEGRWDAMKSPLI